MRFCPLCRIALDESEPACPRDGQPGRDVLNEAIPEELGERFTIVEPFARGDSGALYLADERQTGRRGILKILRVTEAVKPAEKQRLRRELVRQATLNQTGLTLPYATGEAGGLVWLFREWVEGISLRVRLARAGALPSAEALAVAAQLAEALDGLHHSGLLHRDLKPGHVLLRPQPTGLPKVTLIDAGIAGPIATASAIDIVGTPAYVSPEQAGGRLVSFRSDLYALGCVIYEMLTGNPPFIVDSTENMLRAHIEQSPPSLGSDLPSGVSSLVASLLEKEPRKRPFSAQQVRRALDPFLPQATPWERESTQSFGTPAEGVDLNRVPELSPEMNRGTGTLRPLGRNPTLLGLPASEPPPALASSIPPADSNRWSRPPRTAPGVGGVVPREPLRSERPGAYSQVASKKPPTAKLDLTVKPDLFGKVSLAPPASPSAPRRSDPPQEPSPRSHGAPPRASSAPPPPPVAARRSAPPAPSRSQPSGNPSVQSSSSTDDIIDPSGLIELGDASVVAPRPLSLGLSPLPKPPLGERPRGKSSSPPAPLQVQAHAAPPKRRDDSSLRMALASLIGDPRPNPATGTGRWMRTLQQNPWTSTPVIVIGALLFLAAAAATVGAVVLSPSKQRVENAQHLQRTMAHAAIRGAKEKSAAAPSPSSPPQPLKGAAPTKPNSDAVQPPPEPTQPAPEPAEPPAEPRPVSQVAALEPVVFDVSEAESRTESEGNTSKETKRGRNSKKKTVQAKASRERAPKPEPKPRAREDKETKPASGGGFAEARDEARAHFQAGRFKQAIAAYERATALDPSHAGSFAGLGASRLAAGNAQGAIQAYQRAISLSPGQSGFYAALGRAYLSAGQKSRAAAAYRKALELNPGNAAAKKALAELE